MSKQDQIVDDDEPETCPLCIEELDVSDKKFRPCPCGYQICQFCHHHLKTEMNNMCPACRRPYDDNNIKWEAPSAEDVARQKELKAQQEKKKAAAKRQEAATRHADTLSRKHLAGIRVRRQNLVYVTGLRLNTSEPHLSEILRGPQFFGQYGKIDKIVVNKPKDSRSYQHVGVYVTFFEKEAAALCIDTLHGSQNSGGNVRADYGTTKYCSAFLRNEICSNKNCTFLHEVGEENESFTRAGLSSLNAKSSQAAPESSASQNQPAPSSQSQLPQLQTSLQQAATQQAPSQQLNSQPIPEPEAANQAASQAASQPMERRDSQDASSPVESSDGSALPSTASWARESLSRRPSQTQSYASASPAMSNANPLPAVTESSPQERPSKANTSGQQSASSLLGAQKSRDAEDSNMEKLFRSLSSQDFGFVFDNSAISSQDEDLLKNLPPMFDRNGGAKRLMRSKQDAERSLEEKDQQVVSQALSAMENDGNVQGGSLQLGGEPDDRSGLDLHQTQLRGSVANPPLRLGIDQVSPSGQLLISRSPVSHQQQQQQQYLAQQLKSNSPGLMGTGQRTQADYYQNNSGLAHSRQTSRFSFANDTSATTSVKPMTNQKLMSQQSSMMPVNQGSQYNAPAQQNQGGAQLFSSGVQGPPPGLKAAGTPPVSGGGMFGQGHGFATAGLGYGVNSTSRNSNDDMMRELLRNRGSSAGSGQTPDAGRREYNLSSFSHQNPSPVPDPGLSSFPYGSHPGLFQDHSQQKQKKKGKKQRHANTSSSGGGVVDLADPSVLHARMHQAGSGAQGQYGAQGQGQGSFAATIHTAASKNRQGSLTVDDILTAPGSYGERWPAPVPAPPPGLSSTPKQAQRAVSEELFSGGPVSSREDLPLMPGLGVIPAQKRQEIESHPVQVGQPSLPESHQKQTSRAQKVTVNGHSKASARLHVNEDAAFPALPKATPAMSADATKGKAGKNVEKASTTVEFKKREPLTDKRSDSTGTTTTTVKPSKQSKQRQHPGKIDIPAAMTPDNTEAMSEAVVTAPSSSNRTDMPAPAPSELSSSPAVHSRPATPSQSNEMPVKRTAQPRTIRVLPTPKAEAYDPASNASTPPPPPIEAANSVSRAQGSRRPSVASLSVPETPASERVADNMSVTTESASRASSPIPDGSEAITLKGKTKKQRKKEGLEKTKVDDEAEEKKAAAEAATHEPVIGRKKKTKKPAAVSTLTSTSTPEISRPPSAAGQIKQAEVAESEPLQDTVPNATVAAVPEPAQEQDSVPETEPEPKAARDIRPVPSNIISHLKSAEIVDPSALDFFKANQNLFSNSRHEIISADLLNTKPIAPLTQAEIEALDAGKPVHRTGSDNRTSSRLLITPSRKCIPRLPADKENRYLDLEKAVNESKAPYRYIHQRKDTSQHLVSADDVLKDMCATLTRPPTTTTVPAASYASPASHSPATNGNAPDSATTSAEAAAAAAVAAATSSYGEDALAYLNHFILPPLPNRNAAAAASAAATNGSADPSKPIAAALSRYFAADPDATLNSLGQSVTSLAGVGGAPDLPGALDGSAAAVAASPEAITQALANAVNGVVQAAAAVTGVSAGELGIGAGAGAGGTGAGDASILGRVMGVDDAERALNAARKENEAIEKRMAALVRKNRRVAGMT